MWIRLKCRAGWLLRLKFSDNLLAEMFSLHQDGGGRSISSRRQHRERAYLRRDWEEQASLRRERGKLFLQHSISLSLPAIRITFFFFSMEIFHKDYRHCREQHRLMAHSWCSFEGHNSSLCPFKAGGVSFFPVETRRSFSVTFSGWAVGALQLCWRPCC